MRRILRSWMERFASIRTSRERSSRTCRSRNETVANDSRLTLLGAPFSVFAGGAFFGESVWARSMSYSDLTGHVSIHRRTACRVYRQQDRSKADHSARFDHCYCRSVLGCIARSRITSLLNLPSVPGCGVQTGAINVGMLIAGRFIAGVAIGCLSMIVPLYQVSYDGSLIVSFVTRD